MRIAPVLTAAIATASVMTSSVAIADTVIVTYTGTVFDSYDYVGAFGPAGSSLDGDAFVATYTFDTAVGDRTTVPGVSDHLDNGGPGGFPGDMTATLTINGITLRFGGTYSWSADADVGRAVEGDADYRTRVPVTDHLVYNYASVSGFQPTLDASFRSRRWPAGADISVTSSR